MIIRNNIQFENETTYNIYKYIINAGFQCEIEESLGYISEDYVKELWNKTINADGCRKLLLAIPVYSFPKWFEDKRKDK